MTSAPAYANAEDRAAYSAGYADGYACRRRENGHHPVQPYSRGYWDGYDDIMSRRVHHR